MTIYLDNNIFIYLENGSLSISDIENIVDGRIETIFYSSAHIEETLEIKGSSEQVREERITKRLHTIKSITKSNYLHQDLNNNVYRKLLHPKVVLDTISEVSFAQSAMKGMSSLLSEEQKEQTRDLLGLETSRLNNYKPQEVIQHLNKKIKSLGEVHSFLGMLELGISYHPDEKSFGLSNRIAGVFELLDMFGYWKDKHNEKSNYARLWDSSHTFFASFCDYFITDDKRTRNKAKVVYEIYNLKTIITSSKSKNNTIWRKSDG